MSVTGFRHQSLLVILHHTRKPIIPAAGYMRSIMGLRFSIAVDPKLDLAFQHRFKRYTSMYGGLPPYS